MVELLLKACAQWPNRV